MSEGNKLFVGSHNIKMQHAEGHGVHIRRLLALAQVNDGAVSLALGAPVNALAVAGPRRPDTRRA